MAKSYRVESLNKLLSGVFGRLSKQKSGKEIVVDCIYHIDSSKKLSINPDKGVFQCWVCETSGSVWKLLYDLKKEGKITQDDIRQLRMGAHIDTKPRLIEEPTEDFCRLPETCQLIHDTVDNGLASSRNALHYLYKRGLTDSIIKDLRLGICNLGTPYSHRIVIPIYNLMGPGSNNLKYWLARTYAGGFPKVLNASSKHTSYKASQCLFNEHTIQEGHPVAITEGVFDAISTAQNVMPAVALLGKEIHPYHISAIKRAKPSKVYVCLDGEERRAAAKVAGRLELFMDVSVVHLPKYKDPNDCTEGELLSAFENAKQSSYF